jgi:hypothetical protein
MECLQLVLGVIKEGNAGAWGPLPLLKRQDTRQDLEQGGLPGPIRAHQGHSISSQKLKVDAGIDDLISVRFVYVQKLHHMLPTARRIRKLEVKPARGPTFYRHLGQFL